MEEEDPGDIMAEAWRQIDMLKAMNKAPPPLITQAVLDDRVMVDDHVCGPMCVHLRPNDNGGYTCHLSGMCFGRQIAVGVNEYGTAVLDFHRTPVAARSPACSSDFRFELYAVACNVITKLVAARERLAVDETKAVKARKAAARAAASEFKDALSRGGAVQWMKILHRAVAAHESGGGGVRQRDFPIDRRSDVALLVTDLYQVLINPYTKVDKKKPNKEFYSIGMLYLLAEGLGDASRVEKDILVATLPPEKLLKSMGVCVSRVTAAKRYIKDALAHLNATSRAKRARRAADEASRLST